MYKNISALIALLTISISISLFAGCSQDKTQKSYAGNTDRDELILAIGSEPEDGFDPTTGWGRYGSPLFQSTLLKRNIEMKIVNDLATEYSVSSNGLVWTIRLRRDAEFSDGKALTSADVVYTFEAAAKSSSVVDLSIMESVEALDDYTVKFTLTHPRSTFVSILASTGIVPKHAHNKDYAQNPVGSGPFKLVQWDRGQQLIVEANPEYYGPKPFFKKITFLYLSEEAAFAAAKTGKVDVAGITPLLAGQQVPGMRLEALDSVDNRGITFPFVASGSKTKEGYPVGNDVTSDISIRKAVNIAIDRGALVEGVLNGYGSPAYTVCDNLPWWNSETVIKDGDTEGAKKILSDGGWKDTDGDGILEKGGLQARFNLIYPSGDQIRQSLAISIADTIKPLGIIINVEGKSWDDIKTLMYSNPILFGWGSHDPLEMYNLYSSRYRGVDWYNPGYYSNTTADQYMDKALAANSEDEAIGYWKKAQWDGQTGISSRGDAPWAWLINLKHLYLVNENLSIGKQKIHTHGHGWPLTANIEEWRWGK